MFLFAAFVYVSTMEKTGSFWDCGEFVPGAYKLQVVHPPGAPFFNIIGRIFTLFAFAFMYLNKPSKKLTYLSQAAYPVYILHMIFIYLASSLLFDLEIHVVLKFTLTVISTFIGSFFVYEFIIKRVGFLRPLFGLKKN